MAKFAKGVDHRLPNVEGDAIKCVAGQDIPGSKLAWFRKYKPSWIAGGKKAEAASEKAIEEAPQDKMVHPMSTKRK